MRYQPNDVSHRAYDGNTLKTVDQFFNNTKDSCATSIREQSPLDYQYDEFELLNLFEDPINEVTITTTPSDVENNNKNDTGDKNSPKSNLNEDPNLELRVIEKILKQTFDEITLQNIDDSIQERAIFIEVQPPTNFRPRYKSDGKRQIEKSRTTPMVIRLPDLKHIELESNQSFLIRLCLITYSENPSDQIYHHVNKLEYHSNNITELDDGSICVPLSTDDIKKGKKALPRSSLVKTKLASYKSELIPYSVSGNNNKLHKNLDENEKISVKEAKNIFKKYDMEASRIACQLLIKQNETIHFTNITCETHVIKEKDPTKTINKRSAKAIDSEDEESLNEHPTTAKSKLVKRKKRYSNC